MPCWVKGFEDYCIKFCCKVNTKILWEGLRIIFMPYWMRYCIEFVVKFLMPCWVKGFEDYCIKFCWMRGFEKYFGASRPEGAVPPPVGGGK